MTRSTRSIAQHSQDTKRPKLLWVLVVAAWAVASLALGAAIGNQIANTMEVSAPHVTVPLKVDYTPTPILQPEFLTHFQQGGR